MPSDPIVATVGTPTPTPKRPTLYLCVFPQGGWGQDKWGRSPIVTDVNFLYNYASRTGAFLVTIPGETDAAPRPTGDVLAAADALASAAKFVVSHDGYAGTASLENAVNDYLAARNATTKKETPDPAPTL